MSITFAPPKPMYVLLADPDRLLQIAWNLLSNAVKFSNVGDRVTVTIEERSEELAVTVSDTGSGIDPALLPLVFDRFTQADSSSTRRHGGLGLGLSIVRHLVEMHGGRVEAHSAGLGQGATFTFILPNRPDAEDKVAPAPALCAPQQEMDAVTLKGVRVVVVDDEDDSRELARIVLARAGAELRTAASASEAFEAVRAFRPHVLVSDIAMPEEDGYSLIRRVMELEPREGGGIPSIAVTAYASESDRACALALGFSTHIPKPLQPDLLVAAVANLAAVGRAP
jgi:CheY-like chemotaxis protein